MILHPVVPGSRIEGDWFDGSIPSNIIVGENCLIDSAHTFHDFNSREAGAVRLGDRVTLVNSRLSSLETGRIEIGDDCHLQGAVIAVSALIVIGDRCVLGSNVTVFDNDFHPIDHLARRQDSFETRPLGNRDRVPLPSAAVVIGDDVWISPGATVAKGVSIGDGAQVLPGAVVLHDVEPGVTVVGNPARPV